MSASVAAKMEYSIFDMGGANISGYVNEIQEKQTFHLIETDV
jgi:hypothetical protein